MTHIDELIDPDLLATHIADGNIRTVTNDDGYRLFNYAHKVQFGKLWDDATRQCRGLIVDPHGTVAARPFPKFFNLGELDEIPAGPFTVAEKLDGSLGVVYRDGSEQIVVATRGSFCSDQAMWARNWLDAHPEHRAAAEKIIDAGATPLVEIIYPENRIVVDYAGLQELVYLTSIDIATGLDVDADWPGRRAMPLGIEDLSVAMLEEVMTEMPSDNSEGFVLLWSDGTRAKAKHAEYVRLHRLLTGVNARTIWDLLANHQSVDQLIEVVPDEFFQWVKATVADLNAQFSAIEKVALAVLSDLDRSTTRAQQAEIVKTTPYPNIVFLMLDQRDYAPAIWKMIKPSATQPFRPDDT